MSLGFTVDQLLPFARTGTALRMGLTRIGEAEWLRSDFDRQARARVFDVHPGSVAVLPGAEAAAAEAASLVSGGETRDLGIAARGCWEDLCVLEQEAGEGPYRLTAAALGYPTDWRLDEKLGKPMAAIHAPIHGYAEQLSAGVDHFMTTLTEGQIFGRANWFVVESDALRYLPEGNPAERFAHVTAENAGETLFVRCERQTLRRLPETGAILFTIGIAVEPLRTLSDDSVTRVAAAIGALPEGEGNRRAAPLYAEALCGYAAMRTAYLEAAE